MRRRTKKYVFIIWLIAIGSLCGGQNLPQACGGSKMRYSVKGLPQSVFEWEVSGGEIINNNNNVIDIQWDSNEGIHAIKVIQHTADGCAGQPVYGYVMVSNDSRPCISNSVLIQKIPNGFTPNNDNDNDRWRIDLLGSYPEASVSIYNRWGQQVYRVDRNYPAEGWDGTSNGQLLPMSTYFFVIDLKDGSPPLVGSVNLIR